MSLHRITVALLGMALIVLCGCGDETSDRFFSLPSDPPGTFIEARIYRGRSASMLQELPSFKAKKITILGDGAAALLIERFQGWFQIYESQLTEEELEELFELVLRSSVMEHEPRRTRKVDMRILGMRREGRGYRTSAGVTIYLLETNCPGRPPSSPVTSKVSCPVLDVGRQHLEQPEVEALAELGQRLVGIQRRIEREGYEIIQFSE